MSKQVLHKEARIKDLLTISFLFIIFCPLILVLSAVYTIDTATGRRVAILDRVKSPEFRPL